MTACYQASFNGADGLVERVLAGAAGEPSTERARAAVQEGLRRAAGGDPARRRSVPPPAGVATDGADIGVALFEPDGRAWLLGART